MIDTICLDSPEIDEELAKQIESFCIRRSAIDLSTGELQYEFTSGDLRNSADTRISVKVLRDKWIKETACSDLQADSVLIGKDKKQITHKVSCGTYLRVEASVHKLMLGHNIYGGSSDFQRCCIWFINKLEELLQVDLPKWYFWHVNRVDVAEVYNMGSKDVCFSWFEQMQNVNFPRRNMRMSKHGLTGLYFPGTSTTLKFYHKGTEFRQHDKNRIKKVLSYEQVEKMQEIADNIIRVELEVKSRKLKYDFGLLPFVCQVSDDYLCKLHDDAVMKIMNCVGDDVKVLNRTKDVEKYLYSNFSGALAGTLFGTWMRLSAMGEGAVKKNMAKATFLRHKKILKESGISWIGSDVVISDSIVPVDFLPLRNDRHYYGLPLKSVTDMLNGISTDVA